MNITILAPYSRPHETAEAEGSGMNQYIRESAMSLAESGHSVTIVVRKSRVGDKNFELAKGVYLQFVEAGPAQRIKRKGAYSALCEHKDKLKVPQDTDLFIAHYWLSTPWIEKIREQFIGTIIYCSHSLTFNPRRTHTDNEALIAESKLLSQVTWCANTKQELSVMKNLLPKDRLFLTYPGVDLSNCKFSQTPASAGDAPKVLFLGRMNEAKGFDLFCSATTKKTEVNFLAVGRPEIDIKHAANLTVLSHVTLNEAYKFIQDSDVIVCPSRYEHFGFVPLISALLNKKIVATNEGVVGDLKALGYKNLFLSELNESALLKAIESALSAKTVTANDTQVLDKFSWKRWSADIIKAAQTSITVYSGRFAHINITPKETDDGIVWYESVTMPGSVHVIPVNTKGEYGFITEVRFENSVPTERILSGAIDINEVPEDAARRELEEETGLKTDKLKLFYSINSNGTLRDKKFYYLAYNCENTGNIFSEKGEKILSLNYYSKDEIRKKFLKNEYSPSSTIALLTLCDIFPVD